MYLHLWKFSRELGRILLQLKTIPQFFYEPWLRARHDRLRESFLKPLNGDCLLTGRVALFLLYQPHGLPASVIHTCQHLNSKGYSVLVVSNAALTDRDIPRLIPCCWRILQRPNFGYDFGGYRDGIWWLQRQAISLQHLLILNDSIWFPILENTSILEDMEKLDADFVGAAQLGVPSPAKGHVKRQRSFFGSYFWLLNQAVLMHPNFGSFWSRYKTTSNKHQTVRRGERGFCFAMQDAGLKMASIFSRTMLDQYIDHASPKQRLDLLSHLCEVDPWLDRKRIKLCKEFSDTVAWSEQALEIILTINRIQNVFATAPITCLQIFGVPYFKKASTPQNLKAIEKILEHHQAGKIALSAVVVQEMQALLVRHRTNL